MVLEIVLALIFIFITPLMAPAITFRLYEVDPECFKKVKIKRPTFLFCGIGGKDCIYGDVKKYGVILPLFVVQLVGYILTILQIILAPILIIVEKIEYLVVLVNGGVFALYTFSLITLTIICICISKRRSKMKN